MRNMSMSTNMIRAANSSPIMILKISRKKYSSIRRQQKLFIEWITAAATFDKNLINLSSVMMIDDYWCFTSTFVHIVG